MLTVKEWLQSKSNAQFEPLMHSAEFGIIKARRLLDDEVFELDEGLGLSTFIFKEEKFILTGSICQFWENHINVTIQIEIIESHAWESTPDGASVMPIYLKKINLEIDKVNIKELIKEYGRLQSDFIKTIGD